MQSVFINTVSRVVYTMHDTYEYI